MATRQKNVSPPPPLANGHDKPEAGDETSIEVVDSAAETVAPATESETVAGADDAAAQLEAMQRRAEAAEAEVARQRAERAKDAEVIQDSRLTVIQSTIANKTAEKERILKDLKEAKEAGDYGKETELTDQLSRVNLDLRQVELGKDRIEQEIEAAKSQPQTEDAKIEKFFADNNIGEPSRRWLREHRDYLTDTRKNAHLTAAHLDAVASGHAPNTDAYFSFIEEQLGMRQSEMSKETVETAKPEVRQAAPVAPVSRQAGAGGGGSREVYPGIMQTGPGKYSILNNAQGQAVREAAQISGMTVAEYVQQAVLLQRGPDGQLH